MTTQQWKNTARQIADGFGSFVSSVIPSQRGLSNMNTGAGGASDKGAAGAQWGYGVLDYQQLTAMYRSNWMARKIVDIPVNDMLRNGWEWSGEAEQVQSLEDACKEQNILSKVAEAMKLGRLYGGCAIYISTGFGDSAEPLDITKIPRGSNLSFTVMPVQYLSALDYEHDIASPNFGLPKAYSISGSTEKAGAVIHPSRIVRFTGIMVPKGQFGTHFRWGDSVLDPIEQIIRDATSIQQGIASITQEASLDVIKIKDLMRSMVSEEDEAALKRRVNLAFSMKSTNQALILDGEDDWQQKTQTFGGLPEVSRLSLQTVSGAADIPATRFLGQSPDGLNASGDGDLRNYYDRLKGEQTLNLCPALDIILGAIKYAVLGDARDVDYTLRPLWQMTEREQAEIGKMRAETGAIYDNAGLVDPIVLRRAISDDLSRDETYSNFSQIVMEVGDIEPPEDTSAGDLELGDASVKFDPKGLDHILFDGFGDAVITRVTDKMFSVDFGDGQTKRFNKTRISVQRLASTPDKRMQWCVDAPKSLRG